MEYVSGRDLNVVEMYIFDIVQDSCTCVSNLRAKLCLHGICQGYRSKRGCVQLLIILIRLWIKGVILLLTTRCRGMWIGAKCEAPNKEANSKYCLNSEANSKKRGILAFTL